MARLVVPGDDPHRGRRIGKYEILTRLSVGGMAELYLAFTSGPGGFRKFVALKQILPDVKTDEFVKMFLDEARITAAFTHANIGQVYELGQEDGELYLAMEFIPGQNLEQVMVAASYVRPVPVGFAARVVRDVCLGLHYAHHFTAPSGRKVAVVHRDLAPRNVMVTYDGGVKVIDFGIAKARGRIARTQVGMVKGTSGYMSPEQVRNQELDGRSDLFCAGVLLHEMLCSRRVFSTTDEDAMMRQIADGNIPSPRSLNPDIPEAVEAVVMRALEKDPARRFATGKEMAKAIEAAVGSELFEEEAVAELMQALFADKRMKTLALLEHASREEEPVSESASVPQDEAENTVQDWGEAGPPALPPPRQSARASAPNSRPPLPRRLSSGVDHPVGPPARAPRPPAPRMPEAPPRRVSVAAEEDSSPTQVAPPPPKPSRSAPPSDSRRPPKMGAFTLGPVEPKDREDREDSETSMVSRVSRVSRMMAALEGPRRRGLWITLGLFVLVGLAVLFMPESMRAALRPLMGSARQWMSDRMAPSESPTAPPSSSLDEGYEPPPPGEGSAETAAPAKTPAPPRPKKPAAPVAPVTAKPAKIPAKESGEPAVAPPPPEAPPTPAAEAQEGAAAETPPAEEEAPPSDEPSTGPAEVDPSLRPLEETLPAAPEGEP